LGFGVLQMTGFKKSELKDSAYGTKDGNFKYNIGLSTRVSFLIHCIYTNDVNEIATLYDIEKKPLNFTIRDL
jgi:hypothetical protein